MEVLMKIILLIIGLVILISPYSAMSVTIEMSPEMLITINEEIAKDKKSWISGVMTRITSNSVSIDKRAYRMSQNALIIYPEKGKVKDINIFRAMESAKIRARISEGTVSEIYIVEILLRD
jgi:hypothetical protein